MGEPEIGLAALILAGGASARMGQDKIWVELGGLPLVERVARRVLPLARELIFCTNTPDRFAGLVSTLPVLVRLAPDRFPEGGPLAGLHAGLAAATCDLVVAVAADMPFVNTALLRYMADLAPAFDAVVPLAPCAGTGQLEWEPLHAVYRRTCLPAVEAQLAAGRRRVIGFLQEVRTRAVLYDEILPFDSRCLAFRNVNTPQDLEDARQIIAPAP